MKNTGIRLFRFLMLLLCMFLVAGVISSEALAEELKSSKVKGIGPLKVRAPYLQYVQITSDMSPQRLSPTVNTKTKPPITYISGFRRL
ncbi:MAG: hypothetical protein Q8J64_08415 [Thermodesulfovibrionales bacterium]|nr:hypothetical protein [Thermodesulfovibrionales bacterium]